MHCCFDARDMRRHSMERVALLRRGIALEGVTVGYNAVVGIVLTALSLIVMPILARAKLRVAASLGSQALRADAHETIVCAWLSATTLLGLGLNAVVGWWWADPVAALGMLPLIVHEGIEAWRGEAAVPDRAASD